jgi:hypothetical protein
MASPSIKTSNARILERETAMKKLGLFWLVLFPVNVLFAEPVTGVVDDICAVSVRGRRRPQKRKSPA